MTEDHPPASTPPTDTSRAYDWLIRGVGGKFGSLLIAMVALLLSAPLILEGRGWRILYALFASAVLVMGLQAARPGRSSLRIGLVLAMTDLGIGQLLAVASVRWLVVVQAILWLTTLVYVTIAILDAVFTRKVVDAETLQAALCAYLLIGLIWVYLFALTAMAAPGSFRSQGVPPVAWTDDLSRQAEFLRLFVFSYSTLASTGFGDLTPGNGFTIMCANLEGLIAQVYLAVVIARLVGLRIASISP